MNNKQPLKALWEKEKLLSLLFPQHFLLNQITVSPSVHILDIIFFLSAAEFEELKLHGKHCGKR